MGSPDRRTGSHNKGREGEDVALKLIHLTDTHMVPKGRTLFGRDPRVPLDAAIADINAHQGDAELLVLTGDLTHWGAPKAFERLAEALAPLTVPIRLLIGNHDDREAYRQAFPFEHFDSDGFAQSALDVSAGRFLFLDTVRDGSHAGIYCERRQRWLKEELERAAGRDTYLFMHHPPFITGLPAMDRIGLKNRDEFRAVVEPFRHQIRHLFFGHLHRPIAGSWLGIPMSTVRSMNHQTAFSLEDGTSIPGNFEPPAYCVVLIEADRVVVHFHDFLDRSERFFLDASPWDDDSREPG